MSEKIKSFSGLKKVLPESNGDTDVSKEEYQQQWRSNMYNHRKMISKKNLDWMSKKSENSEFFLNKKSDKTYDYIQTLAEDEKTRNFIVHLITNFLPLNNSTHVPRLPEDNVNCPITGLPLTDTASLVKGDRDKNIVFTGLKTNVFLSSIAIQELYRFSIEKIEDFDTPLGHIVNYAFDKIRFNGKN